MNRYMIERIMPGVGGLGPEELKGAAMTSNEALAKLAPRIKWIESYVTAEKTFCIYEAEDEAVIQEHSELSGFPANIVTRIGGMIDPSTAD